MNFLYKKTKKNFTRCQDVKTICYMFFFSKKSVHYESSTMYQVNRCQEWESKPSLSTKKKKKFVNVKPVRFLHSTRSEMKKKKKIKAYVEQVTTTKWPFFDSHSQESRCRSCTSPFLELSFGERPGQGCWFYKYCRSLDILYIYIHKYIYI